MGTATLLTYCLLLMANMVTSQRDSKCNATSFAIQRSVTTEHNFVPPKSDYLSTEIQFTLSSHLRLVLRLQMYTKPWQVFELCY